MAKLSTSSTGGTGNFAKVLFNEDKLLRENIEKYDTYKRLKGKKSNKVSFQDYLFLVKRKPDCFVCVDA